MGGEHEVAAHEGRRLPGNLAFSTRVTLKPREVSVAAIARAPFSGFASDPPTL
jgi:hypothetical protein